MPRKKRGRAGTGLSFPSHDTGDSGHEIRFSVWTLSPEHFDLHGRTVGQNFGHTGCDLVCIVAHADDRVGAELGGMLNHQLVRVCAGSFTQLRVQRDIAAEQRLQPGADVADDAARADDDTPNDTQVL